MFHWIRIGRLYRRIRGVDMLGDVIDNMKRLVRLKKKTRSHTTIGAQMVAAAGWRNLLLAGRAEQVHRSSAAWWALRAVCGQNLSPGWC